MERNKSHRGGETRSAYHIARPEQPAASEVQEPRIRHERIDCGIAEALREGRSISQVTARAIAAELYVSPDTPLHALAMSGALVDGLAAELAGLRTEAIPAEVELWLDALDGYVAARADVPESGAAWTELSTGDSSPTPRSAAFQLALDLQWAHDHRPDDAGQRVAPADAEAVRGILIATVDVLAGRRALAQIRHQFGAIAFAAIQTRAREAVRSAEGFRLCSVHTYQSAKGVIEACGTVESGKRCRALVARLEARRKGWQCTMVRVL